MGPAEQDNTRCPLLCQPSRPGPRAGTRNYIPAGRAASRTIVDFRFAIVDFGLDGNGWERPASDRAGVNSRTVAKVYHITRVLATIDTDGKIQIVPFGVY